MIEKSASETTKILEPTFHFSTKHIKIGEDYTTATIPVSELVTANQLLADFPDSEKYTPLELKKIQQISGENTRFTKDQNAIFATFPGYPKIHYSQEEKSSDPPLILSIEPLFIVSPDKMKVTLAIHPALPDGRSLRNTNLKELLTSMGIVYGLDKKGLSEAQQYIDRNEPEFNKVVIARGRPADTGMDAYLHFEIEIGPIAGTVMRDGTLDFRDRRIMVGVKNKQCVATKIPAVPGNPGINVLGEETPAPEGKDLKIAVLGDAQFSEETMQVIATKDGVLSVVNNNVIKVSSRQVIAGDIDYSTGNIDSRNCVAIHGSVQPGFLVTADGDLEISGSVMSTTIKSLGNVVIKGGITGKKSLIHTAGDCDINFIEQGKIISGGLCVVRSQSYYSDIYSGSFIRFKDNSKIMSGSLIAEGNITVADVGSNDCKPSLIAAGVVAERLIHYRKLKAAVEEQQDAIIKWVQHYPGSSSSKKIKKMEQELTEKKLLLLKTNLIPGTGIYSRVGPSENGTAESGDDYSNKGAIDISSITIDVLGTIYAGTKIMIGNRSLKLDKTISSRQFILHTDQKSIIAKPLKRQ